MTLWLCRLCHKEAEGQPLKSLKPSYHSCMKIQMPGCGTQAAQSALVSCNIFHKLNAACISCRLISHATSCSTKTATYTVKFRTLPKNSNSQIWEVVLDSNHFYAKIISLCKCLSFMLRQAVDLTFAKQDPARWSPAKPLAIALKQLLAPTFTA